MRSSASSETPYVGSSLQDAIVIGGGLRGVTHDVLGQERHLGEHLQLARRVVEPSNLAIIELLGLLPAFGSGENAAQARECILIVGPGAQDLLVIRHGTSCVAQDRLVQLTRTGGERKQHVLFELTRQNLLVRVGQLHGPAGCASQFVRAIPQIESTRAQTQAVQHDTERTTRLSFCS